VTTAVVVVLTASTAAGVLALLDAFANRFLRPVPAEPERSVPELGVEHEDFAIRSGDHELAAWLVPARRAPSTRPLVLLAHGWGASYGTVLQLAEPLVEAGHDVLLFDVRGHGRNEPLPYVTVRHFRDDVMAVVRYARQRFGVRPLALVGHSFGGAAGVLAAAEGADIDALVLIAAPADVVGVTAEYMTDKGLPGRLLVNVLRPFWWVKVGGTFGPLTPCRRIGEVRVPILILQPEHDLRVGRDHAVRLADAADLEYHVIGEREHTDVLAAPETVRLVVDHISRLSAHDKASERGRGRTRHRRSSRAARAGSEA
jgi:pimeloyl-ACP methyl ester carboxylesterase